MQEDWESSWISGLGEQHRNFGLSHRVSRVNLGRRGWRERGRQVVKHLMCHRCVRWECSSLSLDANEGLEARLYFCGNFLKKIMFNWDKNVEKG